MTLSLFVRNQLLMARFLVMEKLSTLFPSYSAANLAICLFWFQQGIDTPINGDFWCDSYQSVKKFILYTFCLSPSSVLSDIRLMLSTLSTCYSFRITLKPRVKSFFPVKRNLHLESSADVPLHLNGINSFSWTRFQLLHQICLPYYQHCSKAFWKT